MLISFYVIQVRFLVWGLPVDPWGKMRWESSHFPSLGELTAYMLCGLTDIYTEHLQPLLLFIETQPAFWGLNLMKACASDGDSER